MQQILWTGNLKFEGGIQHEKTAQSSGTGTDESAHAALAAGIIGDCAGKREKRRGERMSERVCGHAMAVRKKLDSNGKAVPNGALTRSFFYVENFSSIPENS